MQSLIYSPPPPDDQHPALVYVRGLSPGSRATAESSLDAIARLLTLGICDHRSLAWPSVRYRHFADVRSLLLAEFSPATARKMMYLFKGVLRQCRRLGWISADELLETIDVDPIKGSSPIRGRALEVRELTAIFDHCLAQGTNKGFRDAALLAVTRYGGLRRSEAAKLTLSDLDLAGASLLIRSAKGNKTDRVVLPQRAIANYLRPWLGVRGLAPGPLFYAIAKGDHLQRRRGLSVSAVAYVFQARAQELRDRATALRLEAAALRSQDPFQAAQLDDQAALLDVADFAPHDLRRTYITELHRKGVAGPVIQEMARHSSYTTTAKYFRAVEDERRSAADLLD